MNRLMFTVVILAGVALFACKKEDDKVELTPYELLTSRTWVSDSLLADGEDAGGEGQLLYNFNGDAEFRTDGTGTFGEYTGTWSLSADNKEVTITTDQIPIPIIAAIVELTEESLKITTEFPDMSSPGNTIHIRMTFKKK
jgi:hypothetical protein